VARAAAKEESMPPERPTTTPAVPEVSTASRMKPVRTCTASGALRVRRSRTLAAAFIPPPRGLRCRSARRPAEGGASAGGRPRAGRSLPPAGARRGTAHGRGPRRPGGRCGCRRRRTSPLPSRPGCSRRPSRCRGGRSSG